MTGILVKTNGEWVVKYDRGHEVLFYRLDQQSKEWTKKDSVLKFIREGIEVQFNLVVNGSYDHENEIFVKEFSAKIKQIEHSTI